MEGTPGPLELGEWGAFGMSGCARFEAFGLGAEKASGFSPSK